MWRCRDERLSRRRLTIAALEHKRDVAEEMPPRWRVREPAPSMVCDIWNEPMRRKKHTGPAVTTGRGEGNAIGVRLSQVERGWLATDAHRAGCAPTALLRDVWLAWRIDQGRATNPMAAGAAASALRTILDQQGDLILTAIDKLREVERAADLLDQDGDRRDGSDADPAPVEVTP